jgi:hypothetical protein
MYFPLTEYEQGIIFILNTSRLQSRLISHHRYSISILPPQKIFPGRALGQTRAHSLGEHCE